MNSIEPEDLTLTLLASLVAAKAHRGQKDKAGQPYIRHPQRVAARVTGRAKTVALLHDVVEDTTVTLDDLAAQFPNDIVAAVDAITHRKGEPRHDYYRRVAGNELAYTVKLADIADNTDPQRLAELDADTRARLAAKYANALAELAEHRNR